MYFSKSLVATVATTACIFTSTLALPQGEKQTGAEQAPSDLTKRVNPNEQSCTAADFFNGVGYSVLVGVSYNGGSGCGDIWNALNSRVPGVWGYTCLPSGDYTSLGFNADKNHGGDINAALASMYPMVNGFNCPDY